MLQDIHIHKYTVHLPFESPLNLVQSSNVTVLAIQNFLYGHPVMKKDQKYYACISKEQEILNMSTNFYLNHF